MEESLRDFYLLCPRSKGEALGGLKQRKGHYQICHLESAGCSGQTLAGVGRRQGAWGQRDLTGGIVVTQVGRDLGNREWQQWVDGEELQERGSGWPGLAGGVEERRRHQDNTLRREGHNFLVTKQTLQTKEKHSIISPCLEFLRPSAFVGPPPLPPSATPRSKGQRSRSL